MVPIIIQRTGIVLVAIGAWFLFENIQTRSLDNLRGPILLVLGAILIFVGLRQRRRQQTP